MRTHGILRTLVGSLTIAIAGAQLAFHHPSVSPGSSRSSSQAAFLYAQAQPAGGEGVVRVQAPSVVVDVIVTDKKGRHVEGLKGSDFSVFEDKVPQKIVAFESTSSAADEQSGQLGQPKPQATSQPAPSASVSEESKVRRLARSMASVRFITLVMDMGDLQPANVKHACDAAVEYVNKVVAPEDFLAVYRVDDTLHLVQPFTRDKQPVVEALKALSGRVPSGMITSARRVSTQEEINELNAKLYGLQAVGGPGPGVPGLGAASGTDAAFLRQQIDTLRSFLFTQSTMQAKTVFVALRAIALSYADIPGRKNVVMFSQGFVRSPDARSQLTAVIDAANRANVAIYVVDASGLKAGFSAQSSTVEPTENQQMYEISQMGTEHTEGMNKFDYIQTMGTENLLDNLGQLAAETGGLVIENQNDLLPGLAKVDSDLREFYTLVYQPTNTNYDGQFRRIKVTLAKPGYHLRYRVGYWAIPPGEEMMLTPAAAQLLAGAAGASLKSAFAPHVNGAVLLAPDGELAAPVKISLPAERVKFTKDPKRDAYVSALTLVVAARDTTGKLATVHQRFLALDFTKKQLEAFRQSHALEINARLSVSKIEPLNLEAILQFADGRVAIGQHELLAGATEASGVRLTSLLLTDHIAPASGPADPSDPLRGSNFELFLPDQARFSPSSKLTVYFGALNVPLDSRNGRPALHISFLVKQGEKTVMTLPSEVATGSAGQSRLLVLKQVDLGKLQQGRYTLQVEAQDSTTHQVATRSAEFAIR